MFWSETYMLVDKILHYWNLKSIVSACYYLAKKLLTKRLHISRNGKENKEQN